MAAAPAPPRSPSAASPPAARPGPLPRRHIARTPRLEQAEIRKDPKRSESRESFALGYTGRWWRRWGSPRGGGGGGGVLLRGAAAAMLLSRQSPPPPSASFPHGRPHLGQPWAQTPLWSPSRAGGGPGWRCSAHPEHQGSAALRAVRRLPRGDEPGGFEPPRRSLGALEGRTGRKNAIFADQTGPRRTIRSYFQ